MTLEQGEYFRALSEGRLYRTHVDKLLEEMKSRLTLEEVPPELLSSGETQAKVTEKLSRLPLRVARGPRGWNGLVIGFPGSKDQLTTETLSTPYLREILYPILDLRQRISSNNEDMSLPCLYLLGVRFPDVVLNKFRLLELVIPHIVVLTHDLPNRPGPPELPSQLNEQWAQAWLCQEMDKPEGLGVNNHHLQLGYLTHELPTWEAGTSRERLDILGVDREDKALVAFEIKGPDCSRVQLENLFLQGLAHREWLELNKRTIKFIFDGPRGRRINARKRVRLILGFFQEEVPELFWDMREEAVRRDPYLEIDFVGFTHPDGLEGKLKPTRKDQVTQ